MKTVAVVLALLLCGCAASGPTYSETPLSATPLPDEMARIVFFRTKDSILYVARKAAISIDGEKVGGTAYGGFHYHDVREGNHTLRADMWDMPGRCELTLAAAAGETYYFQVDPRTKSFGAFAAADTGIYLFTENVFASVAGGLAAVSVESYGTECGGAFRLYPVDAATAITELRALKRSQAASTER